jgi:hypothetical protein
MRKQFFLTLLLAAVSFSGILAQTGGTNPALFMYRYNSSPGLSPLPVLQGNLLGTLKWIGLYNYGDIRTGADIRSFVTDPVGPSFQANMIFRTSGAAGITDRVIITQTGLVGIGTMNPQFNLHTVGNTHTTGRFHGRIHFDFVSVANDAPNTYTDEAYFERRMRSTLSVPAVATANNFGGILTLAPGGGAHDHQLFFGQDGIWNRREAENSGAWGGTWEKLLSSGDITGTPNRVAKFLPPDNPSSKLGDSRLFDDGVRVGINNFAPAFDLDITGTTHISANALVDGNLGVGTTTPAHKLHLVGNGFVNGNMAIGPTDHFAAGYALSVNGKIITDEVRVMLEPTWPDYVFEENYPLPDLKEWEQFIKANKHLPGIPSAKEVAANGIELGENQRLLLEKIEQLTLIVIEQQKQIDALKSELKNAKH